MVSSPAKKKDTIYMVIVQMRRKQHGLLLVTKYIRYIVEATHTVNNSSRMNILGIERKHKGMQSNDPMIRQQTMQSVLIPTIHVF